MGRSPRIQAPDITFHIINRGNGKNTIFHSDKDFHEYLELLQCYQEKFDMRIYHYVLMSNHVHILVEPSKENSISKFMQGLTLAHTRRFNMRYQSVGHVWQGRFKSIPIETDIYFLQCGRYIELNPVRAGIVSHPSRYPWSSYQFYAQGKQNKLLNTDPFYDELGSSTSQRRERYTQYIEEELPNIHARSAIRFSQDLVYGSESFVNKLKNDFNYEPTRRKGGRPKINQT